jgi:hypothetical protein
VDSFQGNVTKDTVLLPDCLWRGSLRGKPAATSHGHSVAFGETQVCVGGHKTSSKQDLGPGPSALVS